MNNLFADAANFETILAGCRQMLADGANKAQDPCHTPVLGTVSSNGCSLRTVVLRRIIEQERMLICHTDVRSPKIQDIRRHPQVSWLFYHPQEKVQLRLAGPATLHADDQLADEQWRSSQLMSRRCYRAILAPGTPSDEPTSGLPDFLETRSPTLEESEVGRKNFVAIACRFDFLDWYYLRAKGHRRAQFFWSDNQMSAQWVVP
jgi:hypothetical protein